MDEVRRATSDRIGEIGMRFRQVHDTGVSVRDMLMEMIGTCLFVLVGMLVAVYPKQDTPLSDPLVNGFVVAFAFGMAITVMVYTTAHTSGGHLNPAVTAGCMAAGLTSPMQAAANILAQYTGTVLSAALMMLLVPDEIRDAAGHAVNSVPAHSSVGRAFLAETIGMFMIVLTVLETVGHRDSKAKNCAPIAIGTCFFVCILAFGPVSSGSFNPARAFGPAIVSGNVKDLWIYMFAPLLGAVLAAPVHLLSLSGWDTKRVKKEDGSASPVSQKYAAKESLEAQRARLFVKTLNSPDSFVLHTEAM